MIEGTTVTLNGSAVAGYSILWTQLVGIPVTLSDNTSLKPTFVAPSIINKESEVLKFELKIKFEDREAADWVIIIVKDNGITIYPNDVIPFTSSTNQPLGIISTGQGELVSLTPVDPATIPDQTNRPDNLIYGMIDAEVKFEQVGGTADITVYFPKPVANDFRWFIYNNGWCDGSDFAEFSEDRMTLTLRVVDKDRSGIVKISLSGVAKRLFTSSESTGSTGDSGAGETSGGCFIAASDFGTGEMSVDSLWLFGVLFGLAGIGIGVVNSILRRSTMNKSLYFLVIGLMIVSAAAPSVSAQATFSVQPRIMGGYMYYECDGADDLKLNDFMPYFGAGLTMSYGKFFIDGYYQQTGEGSDSYSGCNTCFELTQEFDFKQFHAL